MAKTYHIAVIPGDGTGPEVVAEGVKVLRALAPLCGLDFEFITFDVGGEAYLKSGTLLPDGMVQELKGMDAIYLGAIGHPDVKPGILEREILLRLRFELDLYINLRPVVLLPGVYTPIKDKGPEDIDFLVIRENTEGFYTGAGGTLRKGTPDEVAVQESVNSFKGVDRCIRYAFEACRRRDRRRKLTLVAKTNVLTFESDLWERRFMAVAGEYPDVTTDYQHVDACCMWMVKNPEIYDVIVTNNMFGDIITDIGAIIQGGLGVAAGGNIHPGSVSMFEPIGGSAPKYAGRELINPMAAICAAQMMLENLGENVAADFLLGAVRKVVGEDLESLDAGRMGMGTRAVGDKVAEAVLKAQL
ncbi:MAG: 3-isopropylmalate dehydrogenase [Desulfatiglandales bacterium]